MNRHFSNSTLIGLTALLMAGSGTAKDFTADSPSAKLSAKAQKIVDYLVADWSGRFRSTTIPHAMENMGMAVDNDIRLEVVDHFRKNRNLARVLRSWGPNNALLTNEEKRVAKLLLNSHRDRGSLPTTEEAVQTLGGNAAELRARLAFMARAGFVVADKTTDLGYALADDANIWGGPLRHNYHTIMVTGEDKFDVWWAIDFLLLVSSDVFKSGVTVKIEDSCAHGTDLIYVEIQDGKIAKMDPPTVFVQRGGGWVVDNLFSSEEHLNDWLDQYPEYRRLQHQSIVDFLESMQGS